MNFGFGQLVPRPYVSLRHVRLSNVICLYRAMADIVVCAAVPMQLISLFSPSRLQQRWASRITERLSVDVTRNDGLCGGPKGHFFICQFKFDLTGKRHHTRHPPRHFGALQLEITRCAYRTSYKHSTLVRTLIKKCNNCTKTVCYPNERSDYRYRTHLCARTD